MDPVADRLTQPFGSALNAQRALVRAARELAHALAHDFEDADLLRLGATCMQIATDSVVQARDLREVIRSWKECALGERQIRLVTYRALKAGCIDNETYDEMFRLATLAAHIRENERQRVRRKIQNLDIV
jgi:hypothetical protein